MKSIFVIILVAFSFNLSAQPIRLDKFFGVPFGSTRDSVKKIMELKPDCSFDEKSSDLEMLVFDNVKFAGRSTQFVVFYFIDNKFYSGFVLLKPTSDAKVFELYKSFKEDFNNKYFPTDKDYEVFKYPYSKDSDNIETAIEVEKATFSCFWFFDRIDTKYETPRNVISLEITPKLMVKITYQDGLLTDQAIAKAKKKNANDL